MEEHRKFRNLQDLLTSGLNELILEVSAGLNPSCSNGDASKSTQFCPVIYLRKLMDLYERVRSSQNVNKLNLSENCTRSLILPLCDQVSVFEASTCDSQFQTPMKTTESKFVHANNTPKFSTPRKVSLVQSCKKADGSSNVSGNISNRSQNFLLLSVCDSQLENSMTNSTSQERKRLKVSMKRLIGELCYRIDRWVVSYVFRVKKPADCRANERNIAVDNMKTSKLLQKSHFYGHSIFSLEAMIDLADSDNHELRLELSKFSVFRRKLFRNNNTLPESI